MIIETQFGPEQDATAIRYVQEYWRLHPDAWDATNDGDSREALDQCRISTWHAVNAATEGALAARCSSPNTLQWRFIFGYAIATFEPSPA